MVDQTTPCPATGSIAYEVAINGDPAQGYVLIEADWTADGVSVRPNCDGPVSRLHTTSTGTIPVWAILPNKRKGNPWYQINPGADITVTSSGTLKNLGLTNIQDVLGVGFQFQDPAVVGIL